MITSNLEYNSATAVVFSAEPDWTLKDYDSRTALGCMTNSQAVPDTTQPPYTIVCLDCGCKFRSYDVKQDICDNCMQELATDCLINLD